MMTTCKELRLIMIMVKLVDSVLELRCIMCVVNEFNVNLLFQVSFKSSVGVE